ncbi:hypothetical protein Acy02nite_87370 [Actinoplanes cyaneus]|uniref:Uncharacterized protein n=1 Tax=Actinoplanes cyaneus TaxID=52696 RepID=A0A919ITQ7_9ACTN|nr:hypothetical protein Acy02nite_87370 [Actinoplanes cyaneus]
MGNALTNTASVRATASIVADIASSPRRSSGHCGKLPAGGRPYVRKVFLRRAGTPPYSARCTSLGVMSGLGQKGEAVPVDGGRRSGQDHHSGARGPVQAQP